MRPPKNILVPVDFSEASNRALAYAQTMAKALGASIRVLHVVPDPYAQGWSIEATGMDLPAIAETWQSDAQKRLDGLSLDAPGERLVRIGQPFSEITRYAESHRIDLIIMGTHGRGAIEHMLLGSVAERVVRRAPCPVLTLGESSGKD